jgi:hypothetical protein
MFGAMISACRNNPATPRLLDAADRRRFRWDERPKKATVETEDNKKRNYNTIIAIFSAVRHTTSRSLINHGPVKLSQLALV